MYEYRGQVTRVIDGDTVRVRLDLGCDVRIDLTLRLMGIDTPELPTAEGIAARAWLGEQMAVVQGAVVVRTEKDRREKYGRYLAHLFVAGNPISLNEQMVQLGLARVYP